MSQVGSPGKDGGARPREPGSTTRYVRCSDCGRIYDASIPHHCPNEGHRETDVAIETGHAPVSDRSQLARLLRLILALAVVILPIGLVLAWMFRQGDPRVPATGDRTQTTMRKPERVEHGDARTAMPDQLMVRRGETFKECDPCPEMVVIPAGRFIMGSAEAERGHDRTEWPQHEVTIGQDFAVGKYEVTVRQFIAFLNAAVREGWFREMWVMPDPGDQGSSVLQETDGKAVQFIAKDGREEYPITFVSWLGATEYANWLSRRTGGKYRLLSEAEWEYAARAGSQTAYHFGNDPSPICEFANLADITGMKKHNWSSATNCEDGYADLAPVGRFQPNSFGLFDMIGNASEWVADCARPTYDGAPTDGSALEGRCETRILRGGSYQNLYGGLRSAKRYASPPDERTSTIGFRVGRSLSVPPTRQPKGPEQRAQDRGAIERIPRANG